VDRFHVTARTRRCRSLVSFLGGVAWSRWLERLGLLGWSIRRPRGTEEAVSYLFKLLVWWQSQVSIRGESGT
jgi:hypothetical protein